MDPPWPPDEADAEAALMFEQALAHAAASRAAAEGVQQDLDFLKQSFAGATREAAANEAKEHALWRMLCLLAPDLLGTTDVADFEHKLIGLAKEVCREDADMLVWLRERIAQLIEDLETGEF